jgi:hypothetical protein
MQKAEIRKKWLKLTKWETLLTQKINETSFESRKGQNFGQKLKNSLKMPKNSKKKFT